jgi:hypothetical protein
MDRMTTAEQLQPFVREKYTELWQAAQSVADG